MYIYLNRILTPNDTISGKSFLLTFGNKVLFCQIFFFLFEFLFSSKQEARKGFVVRRDSYIRGTQRQFSEKYLFGRRFEI